MSVNPATKLPEFKRTAVNPAYTRRNSRDARLTCSWLCHTICISNHATIDASGFQHFISNLCLRERKRMAWKMIALLMFSSAVIAQTRTTRPTPRARPATISGRVFLITRNGDLKPARMASVYLFSSESDWPHQWYLAVNADSDWLNAELPMHREGEEPEARERRFCYHTLMLTRKALQQTIRLAEDNNKPSQALLTEADEDGNFTLTVPRPGDWKLFAYGHAGFNDAFWGDLQDSITVRPGSAYTVKLSSPETACLVTE